jgi:hypothetical protein
MSKTTPCTVDGMSGINGLGRYVVALTRLAKQEHDGIVGRVG